MTIIQFLSEAGSNTPSFRHNQAGAGSERAEEDQALVGKFSLGRLIYFNKEVLWMCQSLQLKSMRSNSALLRWAHKSVVESIIPRVAVEKKVYTAPLCWCSPVRPKITLMQILHMKHLHNHTCNFTHWISPLPHVCFSTRSCSRSVIP